MDLARRVAGVPLVAVVVGLLTTALAWYRLGPVPRNTVWAEDGGVFLRERIATGPLDTLLHPYAGYVHLLPRLIVDLGYALPPERYAQVVALASCTVVGGVCALVFVLSRDVVRPWPLRLVLAAVPVVLPLAPYEISGNAANLHWYLLVLVPWVFAFRTRSWWAAAALAAVAGAAVLTEPLTVLFTPLLLLAWMPGGRGRGRAHVRLAGAAGPWSALPVTLVVLVGLAVQGVTTLTHPREVAPGSPAVRDVLAGYLLGPVGGAWDPRVGAVLTAVLEHGWAVVLVPAVVLLLVLVAAVVVGPPRTRWMVVALSVGSGAVWWAALLANDDAGVRWSAPVAAMAALPPQRYAAAAGLLLVSAAVVAAAALVDAPRWSHGTGRTGGAGRLVGAVTGWCVVTAVVASAVLHVAPAETRRSEGPVWAGQLPTAVEACDADPSLEVARVRSNPWSSPVACSWVSR
ncbi:hypothetical protein [Curtobacterium aurantiacum]|uniref:hypothetical protein n=1 Tax=Curtobacterium aurantiacum TaxID=3236919 RepID=UPI001BE09E34|nr:hypothetical protein [Curtobacterium flaccumfaciens]MBT1676056.1 hypothetical protein [Curtobacterium flaccumfaciens pv. flaccumfaciens]